MSRARRPWVGAETRLVAEWLAARHPDAHTLQHVRVGPITPQTDDPDLADAELRMLGSWRYWVDAILIYPHEVILVEAGILPDPGDVSRLELYTRLWPLTPDVGDIVTLPARGHLVYGVPCAALEAVALEHGLSWETFTPPWVPEYLASRHPARLRAAAMGPGDSSPTPAPPHI